jgi:hypothetical protein
MSDARSFKNILNQLNFHHPASDFLLKKKSIKLPSSNMHHPTTKKLDKTHFVAW